MDDITIFCGSLFFATKSSATKTPHLNHLNYLNYLPNYLPKEPPGPSKGPPGTPPYPNYLKQKTKLPAYL